MTRAEQKIIRDHYSYQRLRFRKDGTVEGQKRAGGAWGLLYSAEEAARHVAVVKAQRIRETHPELCECGRPWNDCATRDDEEAPHGDR
ncbi:MAG TPA: hypothetical protein VFW94_23595 [Candidatus Acidoferrales bacterium]|nr:hypothetical protein [Candidatus Acidoferrales bacterium]